MSGFSVYRFYGPDDAILYVGRSGTLPKRIKEHFRHKPWWAEAARIELEHFDTFEEMAARERELIRELVPRYNVAMMNGQRPVPPKPVHPRARTYENWWEEPFQKPAAVAEAYGVTVATVKAWLSDGLPHLRVGQAARIKFSQAEPWLQERGLVTPL